MHGNISRGTTLDIKISLDKKEQKELNDYLVSVKSNVGNLRPIFTLFVSVMSSSAIENFRAQGREPHAWRELSERRIRDREIAGTWPGNILEEYGTLKQSLIPTARARGSFLSFGKTEVEFGTTLNKAPALQFGRLSRHLPARPFLYFRNEDIQQIMSFAYTFAFQPEVAKRYGSAPTVSSVPKRLYLGTG